MPKTENYEDLPEERKNDVDNFREFARLVGQAHRVSQDLLANGAKSKGYLDLRGPGAANAGEIMTDIINQLLDHVITLAAIAIENGSMNKPAPHSKEQREAIARLKAARTVPQEMVADIEMIRRNMPHTFSQAILKAREKAGTLDTLDTVKMSKHCENITIEIVEGLRERGWIK